MHYRGLTWDHPRGYRALEAAAAEDPVVAWDRQPLEGFESHAIGDLLARYDLVVLDHPHLGEAIAEDGLQPVEDWYPADDLARIAHETVGPAWASYAWGGRHFALPLDVATQVAARDPVQVPAPPDDWDAVERLSARAPVALSLAGPHAVLTFFSLSLALGHPPGGADLVPDAAGREVLDRMAALAARAPAGSDALNPIGLLEAIAAGAGIAYAPLVYGYVPYAARPAGRGRVAFSDAPRIGPGGRRGSVLGGTGIGLSRRCRPTAGLVAHLVRLMSAERQTGFIPDHDGQPSNRRAWTDPAVDARAGGFYGGTLETAETAWVRPRFDGYIAFQAAASARIRAGLAEREPSASVLSAVRDLWRAARSAARGALDDPS